jgi:sigma-B regulation protein RsbU (phosphoserine phosphatase)
MNSDRQRSESESADSHEQAKWLERENRMLRTVLDSMPDNISIKDLEGRYIFDNSSHCRFLGAKSPEDVVGKTLLDFLPPDVAQKFHDEDIQVLTSSVPVVRRIEETVDTDGNSVWMSVAKIPLLDEDGNAIGLVSTTRNVTDRLQAQKQLALYAEELREKNRKLEDDLKAARELQRALLPQKYPRFPRTASSDQSALRFYHYFQSSSFVGGDFFQIFQISDSKAGVFICDVMGHGVRAALVAAILRVLVDDLRHFADVPGRFLRELNQDLYNILKQGGTQMFVTACYLVIDLAWSELHFANAGRPMPICIRRSSGSAEPLTESARPDSVLGMLEGTEYHDHSRKLKKGDMLLLFTDGLYEVENAQGQLFDQRQLQESVRKRAAVGAETLCRDLIREIQQFSESNAFEDDVSILAVEVDHLI